MLIKGNLTKTESGDQKWELCVDYHSSSNTGRMVNHRPKQEESSIGKEQSVIGPDRKRCTLYLLQGISAAGQ